MLVENSFLFVAFFADGTRIEQTPEDRSAYTPEKNCYFDVLSRVEQGDPPVSLVITNGQHTFGVDLRDGHFECNGAPFFQHRPELQKYKNFRPLYFRTVDQLAKRDTLEPISAKIAGYTIGWKADDDAGNPVERIFCIFLE